MKVIVSCESEVKKYGMHRKAHGGGVLVVNPVDCFVRDSDSTRNCVSQTSTIQSFGYLLSVFTSLMRPSSFRT